MKKTILHIAALVIILAEHSIHNKGCIEDRAFVDLLNDFNKNYRTFNNYITEDELMEHMVESKTYTFYRNTNNWYVEIKKNSQYRYEYIEDVTVNGVNYVIIDTFTQKNHVFNGYVCITKFASMSKELTREFKIYNNILSEYIFNQNITIP